jgi:hypothetical protein
MSERYPIQWLGTIHCETCGAKEEITIGMRRTSSFKERIKIEHIHIPEGWAWYSELGNMYFCPKHTLPNLY